ncbi:MAG: hypothetical protein Ct9H300mP24_6820 [Candidatus Neomarinimicrobiota bacterium]|nr:MAG: hypothetical protein Ct9H300mP24_6820 [Candidatus Neomarinimicrobiota bacterium]
MVFIWFLFAVYAVTANDSIQTLGTYIASNRDDFKMVLDVCIHGFYFCIYHVQGFNAGDPAFGRLDNFPEIEIQWYHAVHH